MKLGGKSGNGYRDFKEGDEVYISFKTYACMKFSDNKNTSTENFCLPHIKTRDHPVYRKIVHFYLVKREMVGHLLLP